jgi:hypothetical protein
VWGVDQIVRTYFLKKQNCLVTVQVAVLAIQKRAFLVNGLGLLQKAS